MLWGQKEEVVEDPKLAFNISQVSHVVNRKDRKAPDTTLELKVALF